MNNYPIPTSIEDSLNPAKQIFQFSDVKGGISSNSFDFQQTLVPHLIRVPPRTQVAPSINCVWRIQLINNKNNREDIELNFTDTFKSEGWRNFCESLVIRQRISIKKMRVRVKEKEDLSIPLEFIQKDGFGNTCHLNIFPKEFISSFYEPIQDNSVDFDYDLNAFPGFGIRTRVASNSVTEIVLFA